VNLPGKQSSRRGGERGKKKHQESCVGVDRRGVLNTQRVSFAFSIPWLLRNINPRTDTLRTTVKSLLVPSRSRENAWCRALTPPLPIHPDSRFLRKLTRRYPPVSSKLIWIVENVYYFSGTWNQPTREYRTSSSVIQNSDGNLMQAIQRRCSLGPPYHLLWGVMRALHRVTAPA